MKDGERQHTSYSLQSLMVEKNQHVILVNVALFIEMGNVKIWKSQMVMENFNIYPLGVIQIVRTRNLH